MITLTFGHRLGSESWTAALQSLRQTLRPDGPVNLVGTTVHIDLSTVGFADFVVLGHLLIVIDALSAAEAAVTVRVPTGEPLEGEQPNDPDDARRQRQRRSCRLFLSQSGFEPALQQGPLRQSPPRVFEGAEPHRNSPAAGPVQPAQEEMEAQQLPHRQRKLLPYQWLPPRFGEGLTQSARIESLETALRRLGLPSEDSAALAKGVLAELIENVAEHAQRHPDRSTMALVGGLMIEPEVYGSRAGDFPSVIREFVDWAARLPSPLIRLVVADSGRGLLTVLPEALPSPTQSPVAVEHQAIFDAFDLRKTRRRMDSRPPGDAQGLSKVERIVRGYRGGLLISTGGLQAGRIFATSPHGQQVANVSPGWAPGTFIECDILTRPGNDILQSEDEASTPLQRQAGDRPRLRATTVTLAAGKGLGPDDLERIRKIVAALPGPEGSGLVIAIDTPGGGDRPSDMAIGTCLYEILQLTDGSAATVALVFPNINRRLLALAVEDINEALARHPWKHNPVLVLAPDNRHYWVGGTPEARQILRTLSSAPTPLTMADLAGTGDWAGTAAVIKMIRDETRLLVQQNGTLRLLLRPQDALDTISNDVAERLRQAIITADSSAVQRGRFLTPSLREANRWCEMRGLLSELNAERLAGFALAARVEARALGAGTGVRENWLGPASPPAILWIGRPNHELVSTFARSLTGTDEYFDSISGLRLERIDHSANASNRVLVVTDIVSSGVTLAVVAAELADRHLLVDAVAAVVDARDTRLPHVDPTEIVIRSHRLPLISLATADLEPHDPELRGLPLVPIDPVLARPDAGRRPEPHCLFRQNEYIDTLKRTRAARLGHILRPAGRHYTAYIDPTLLFRDKGWSEKVLNRLKHKIEQAHRRHIREPDRAEICIIHPAETHDDIANVGRELRKKLVEAGLRVAGTVVVPRAALDTHWRFPVSAPVPAGVRHLVVLDSATGRGHTIQQLVRLSTTPTVEVVTAIVLLNGLNDPDALALQQIGTVRRTTSSLDRGTGTVDGIPVRLYFMARTAMSSLDERDCAVCRLHRRYASVPMLAPVPPRLEQQRTWLLHSLDPRSKRRVFEEEATDLLGMHIGQDDCVAYLRWKHDIREAAFDTMRRRDVVRALTAATEQPVVRHALIRLLVAESHWLRAAPLRFPDVTAMVAGLAASLVLSDTAPALDPVLRVQAVTLLADADPDQFIAKIGQITLASLDQPIVLGQVLLEAHCMLATSGVSRGIDDRHVQSLMQNVVSLERGLRERAQVLNSDPDVSLPLPEVRYLISLGRRVLQPSPTDTHGAWAALGRYWMSVSEHNYDGAMWRLDVMLTNLARGAPPRKPDLLREDWHLCKDFLLLEVLPNVRFLHHVLVGGSLMRGLASEDSVRWHDVVNGDGPRQLDEISIMLNTILTDARPGAPDGGQVETLAAQLGWWNRFFLATHVDPARPERSAFLTDIIKSCPVNVIDEIRDVFDQTDCEIQANDESAQRVFCTSTLLREVLSHIRWNAEITHRAGPGQQCFRIVVDDEESDHVTVTVSNTASAPTDHGGKKGLTALHAELETFGASLQPVDVEPPWTYGVSIRLDRWRMS